MPLERFKLPAPDTRLVQHENRIYKFKMTYDWGAGPPFLPCLPRQLHSEMEQVIRAVLHVKTFDCLTLQTNHFQMTCRCSKWRAAEMLSFQKYTQPCKAHSMVYEISVSSKTNDQSSKTSTSDQPIKQSTASKGESVHQPSNDSRLCTESPQNIGTRKIREVDVNMHHKSPNKKRKEAPGRSENNKSSRDIRNDQRSEKSPSTIKTSHNLQKRPQDSHSVEDVSLGPTTDVHVTTRPQEPGRRSPRKHAKQGQLVLDEGSVLADEGLSRRKRREHEISKEASKKTRSPISKLSPGVKQSIRERLRARPASAASPKRRKMPISRNPCISSSSSSNISGRLRKRSLRNLAAANMYQGSPGVFVHRRPSTRSSGKRRSLAHIVKKQSPVSRKRSPRRQRRRASFGKAIEAFVNSFL